MNDFPSPQGLSASLRNVSFAFERDASPVIDKVTLEIESGQSIALIGPSGAGKTTLINLLMGFLEPTAGEIFIQGLSPKTYIETHPGSVAYVPQFPALIRGSLAENVALGVSKADLNADHLRNAIEIAQLGSWVNQLAKGVDTPLSAGSLSGGQIQRVGIARALYTGPKLLVLDEPTGSLDGQTEESLTKALKQSIPEVTTVTVAHRLSTIEDADLVCYLVNGRVEGRGSLDYLRSTIPAVERLAQQFTLN